MMLRRVEAATIFPVTVAIAKLQCCVDADDDDPLIRDLIAEANETIGEMTGLVLGAEIWEMVITDPVGAVRLPREPIGSVVSVNGVAADDYVLDAACGTVTGPWPPGDVVIRFIAGGTPPLGLRRAMLMLIRHWYENREATSETERRPVPLAFGELIGLHRRGWVKA